MLTEKQQQRALRSANQLCKKCQHDVHAGRTMTWERIQRIAWTDAGYEYEGNSAKQGEHYAIVARTLAQQFLPRDQYAAIADRI